MVSLKTLSVAVGLSIVMINQAQVYRIQVEVKSMPDAKVLKKLEESLNFPNTDFDALEVQEDIQYGTHHVKAGNYIYFNYQASSQDTDIRKSVLQLLKKFGIDRQVVYIEMRRIA